MKIAIAQVNLCVGAIAANTDTVLSNIEKARKEGAGLVVFPELTLTSYPPEDLLLREDLYRQIDIAMEQLRVASKEIGVIYGFPEKTQEGLFNTCVYIKDGAELCRYRKRALPNYGVFDEKRYFEPGDSAVIFDLDSIPTSMSICEDIWTDEPALNAASKGAALLININASPYHARKLNEREHVARERAMQSGLDILYVNLVGGQDELVFDGGSMIVNSKGDIVYRAPHFEEGLYLVEVNMGDDGLLYHPEHPSLPEPGKLSDIYSALVMGVRDYVHKNGFKGAVLGLSGGIDSALTLAVAVDALGSENVEVLVMPSRYSASMSAEDAISMAEGLNVNYTVLSIEEPVAAFNELLGPLFRDLPSDATEENIQARCRGILLMALSNKTGKLLLTTGNKSEMSVGYATLYGDMAGGFAPLKDLSKLLTYDLSRWINEQKTIIPQRIIDRPPSAELRPDQKDEDSLPPYEILDPILERYIELDESPETIIASGFDRETVLHVTGLVDRNEYKRRQAAPGVRITKRAFGRDRRYPITSGYREEL